MNPQRYALLREVFLAAHALPAEQRAEFLALRCADDAALRAEVERLLGRDTARLDTPALGAGFSLPEASALRGQNLPPGMPEHLGSYRLLGVLGAGGMGIVYRARQQAPPRDVALKVLRPGQANAAHLARFRFEVEALGRLQHPGIAAIFDAGSFEHGAGAQPYLAMELIDGVPLLEHTRPLPRDARLRVLCAIADAIQHAHQRGVIHRDLKPGNVLLDKAGQPKVLDFGIAAAVDAQTLRTTRELDAATLLGTLPYMSPERLGDGVAPPDTRVDVYSLGVLAYEVLTDRLPFDLDGLTLPAAVRAVADGSPRALSARDATLRGDLEVVVAKAMARNLAERYASAGDLAADLRHVLAHRPITAQPASRWRRVRLFTRRHRALVTGATTTTIALLLGLLATTRALGEARAAQNLAQTRLAQATTSAERAEAVRGFVLGMLAGLDPNQNEGDRGLERLVATATRQLASRFADHPDLEAELRLVLGGILRLAGRFEDAARQVEIGVELRARHGGIGSDAWLEARVELAKVHAETGRWRDAREVLTPLLPAAQQSFGASDERTLRLAQLQVHCLRLLDRLDEALHAVEPLLARLAARPTPLPDLHLLLRLERADAWHAKGQLAPARAELERIVADASEQLGAEDALTIRAMNTLASLLLSFGDAAAAQPLLEAVYRYRQSRYSANHPSLLQVVHNLGTIAVANGDYAEALRRYQQASDGRALALGPRDPLRLGSMLSRANLLSTLGRAREAAPVFAELLELFGDGSEAQPWLQPHALACHARNQARLGEFDAALATMSAAVAKMTDLYGTAHARTQKVLQMQREVAALCERGKSGK